MKRNLFLTFSLLFILYNGALYVINVDWSNTQNTWQDNLRVLENYLLSQEERASVMVGSSMSQRLKVADLSCVSFNLAVSGRSAIDGLFAIEVVNKQPNVVMIEANQFYMPVDSSFIRNQLGGVMGEIKKYCPSQQVNAQPVGVFGTILYKYLNPLFKRQEQTVVSKGISSAALDNIFNETYSDTIKKEIVVNNLSILKNKILRLKKLNSRCVVYEMPMAGNLSNLLIPTLIRSELEHFCVQNKLLFISADDVQKYEFTDQVHLDESSATQYCIYLNSAMAEYLSNER